MHFLLRHADDNLVLAQSLGEWVSHAPELEEDIALANFSLDHLGQARALYTHAAEVEGAGRSEDDLAMLRSEREFFNLILVEQPNGDFAHTMARQFLIDAYQVPLWEATVGSHDSVLGGIAAKALKEARYHLRHSSTWVIRLGDGTDESHRRMQAGLDAMWPYTAEMFLTDEVDMEMVGSGIGADPSALQLIWSVTLDRVLAEAGLVRPPDEYQRAGGRQGFHGEHLGHLLAEMQWMYRSHPGAAW